MEDRVRVPARWRRSWAVSETREVTWVVEDFPVFWERAEGVNVWDADGNRYLDFTSAFAMTGLGHRAEPLGIRSFGGLPRGRHERPSASARVASAPAPG
jgi:hypothetical protein